MDRETMEYSLNQAVAYEHLGSRFTGKIVGQSGENFIVLLDFPLQDGTKAVLVPSGLAVPVSCYWCADTKLVAQTPLTGAQLESGDIPKKLCPYCTKEVRTLTKSVQ